MAAPTNTASMDLVKLADVKLHLGISEEADHPELSDMIGTASRWIEQWCRRKFKYQTYTQELYNGTGSYTLYLRNPPVDSVSAIDFRLSSAWSSQTLTYLRTDDPDGSGLLFWEDTAFPRGLMNVRVTCVSGMAVSASTLDPILVQAALELVEVLWRRKKEGLHLMPSVSMVDGQTHVFRDDPMPRSVRDAVGRYRLQKW